MKYSHFIYIIFLTIMSCKTVEPILYDKNLPKINKELSGINLMIRQGEFSEAQRRLEQAMVLYPENNDFKTIKCFLLIEQNKNREANDLITGYLAEMPENALLYTAKGMLEAKNVEFDKALESFEKSISLSNNLAFPWFQKGLVFYRQSNYEKASECFFKAKQLDFRNPDFIFLHFLCQLYITENLEQNIHLWKSAESKTAEIPSWYYSFYVKALYDINYKDDAENLLNEGLKKYPNDLYLQLFDCNIQLDNAKNKAEAVPDELLGDKIRQILLKLPCPEAADTWINWLDLTNDARLAAECRKYIALYSYSPLTQFWSRKITNED